MKLTKEQVQKRVLQNKEPLDLDKFTWDEETKTFSSEEEDLVLNFAGIDGVKLTAGDWASQTAGDSATQTADNGASQTAGNDAEQKAGDSANQEAGNGANQVASDDAVQMAGDDAEQKAGDSANQVAGDGAKQEASNDAAQVAGNGAEQIAGDSANQVAGNGAKQTAYWSAVQIAGDSAKQMAGDRAKQTAGYKSTHYVGKDSLVTTGYESIVHVKGDNVIIFSTNVPEIIFANKGDIIQIAPERLEGHIKNGVYSVTGEEAVIKYGKIIEKTTLNSQQKRKLLFDTFFEEFCKRTGIKEHKNLFVEIAKQKLAKSSIFYHADDIELQMTSQEAIIEDALKAIDRILGKKDDKSDALKPYQDTFEE